MKSLLLDHARGLHGAALQGLKTITLRSGKSLEQHSEHPSRWNFERHTRPHHPAVKGVWFSAIPAAGTEKNFFQPVYPRYQSGEIVFIGEPFIDLLPLGLVDRYGFRYLYKYDINDDCHPELASAASHVLDTGAKWVSKMNMPAAAARHFLKITGVRLMRLHDIKSKSAEKAGIKSEPLPDRSLEDLLRDGVVKHVNIKPNASEEIRRGLAQVIMHAARSHKPIYYNYLTESYSCRPVESYMTLWVKMYGLDSWNNNPWVFKYEFEVTQHN